jgi:hypothetical protein
MSADRLANAEPRTPNAEPRTSPVTLPEQLISKSAHK